MRKAAFRRRYLLAGWLTGLGFAASIVLLGDFVWKGGSQLAATLAMTPTLVLIASLVFARCAHCGRSLGWISAHKNFDSQPDPRTLDTCPNCGEAFFDSPDRPTKGASR